MDTSGALLLCQSQKVYQNISFSVKDLHVAQARCNNIICLFFFINYVDWGPKVDVVGFCFLDLASNYTPPEELVKWLEAGEKPIYFGFGSLVSFYLIEQAIWYHLSISVNILNYMKLSHLC